MVQIQNKILVCMDVGCRNHYAAIVLASRESYQPLDEFPVAHTPEGIDFFFKRLEELKEFHKLPVVVVLEGYNGYARPIDTYVLERGHRLFNLNNVQLINYKKMVRQRAKSDPIDARKMIELFQFHEMKGEESTVIQEVFEIDDVNAKLKRLTRRRNDLVKEKTVISNRIQSDIESICPGFMSITKSVDNLWFLGFLTCIDDITKLVRMQVKTILKIKGVGKAYAAVIQKWQKTAKFAPSASWVGPMIIRDAKSIYALVREIEQLEKSLAALIPESNIGKRIITIGGFGNVTSATLAGEIGCLHRFPSEASLAMYVGMAVLDNSSGKYEGTKNPKNVNKNAKLALMIAIDHHRKSNSESELYYQKKRSEGKKHNQALRSLGRHLIRVIWSMIKNDRDYINKVEKNEIEISHLIDESILKTA